MTTQLRIKSVRSMEATQLSYLLNYEEKLLPIPAELMSNQAVNYSSAALGLDCRSIDPLGRIGLSGYDTGLQPILPNYSHLLPPQYPPLPGPSYLPAVDWKCTQCHYNAPDKAKFVEHVWSHTEFNTPFYCPVCPFRADEVRLILSHMHTEHNIGQAVGEKTQPSQKHTCSICSEFSTTSKKRLGQHMQVAHKITKHMCDKCDKKGPTSQYNGDKMQYSCDRCCFHTTRQSSLTKHMLSHENKGKYCCSQCNYKTGQKKFLNRHIKTAHQQLRECIDSVERPKTDRRGGTLSLSEGILSSLGDPIALDSTKIQSAVRSLWGSVPLHHIDIHSDNSNEEICVVES